MDAFNLLDPETYVSLYTGDAMLFGFSDDLCRVGKGCGSISGRYPQTPASGVIRRLTLRRLCRWRDAPAYRLAWTVLRHDGKWRIAQHHGSCLYRKLETEVVMMQASK